MQHPVLDRLSRGAAAGIVLFGVVFGWIVAQRVDQVTIAMLGGVCIGTIVCVPVMIVSLLIVRNAALQAASYRNPEVIDQAQTLATANPPALPPARKTVNVPVVMQRGTPVAQVVLTTQTRNDAGHVIELGADLDTLRTLAPIVGVKPPTRANARELGIMGNEELADTLDWLAAHGWVSAGQKGVPRQWAAGATAEAFGQWLEQFE